MYNDKSDDRMISDGDSFYDSYSDSISNVSSKSEMKIPDTIDHKLDLDTDYFETTTNISHIYKIDDTEEFRYWPRPKSSDAINEISESEVNCDSDDNLNDEINCSSSESSGKFSDTWLDKNPIKYTHRDFVDWCEDDFEVGIKVWVTSSRIGQGWIGEVVQVNLDSSHLIVKEENENYQIS